MPFYQPKNGSHFDGALRFELPIALPMPLGAAPLAIPVIALKAYQLVAGTFHGAFARKVQKA
jgi:hypothetical protein